MIESLKLKLMNVLTIDGGTPKLSSLDGLVVEGYTTEVSSLGRIVKMTKDTNTESYFVDDKFNISQLGANISTGTTSASESTVINNINLVLSNIGRSTITVTANVDVAAGSSVKGYIFMINGEVINLSSSNSYSFSGLSQGTTYDISVLVVDNSGKIKSQKITGSTNSALTTRYLVFEVYDHLGGEGAVINEIKISNQSGNTISGTFLNAYESLTAGKPSYWDSVNCWSKDNLFDGQTAYTSNSDGGGNTTILLYNSSPNSGIWCRMLIDLGSEQTINNIKTVVGGTESRMPKIVNVYSVNNYSASTYTNNVAQRNDTGLSLLGTKTFTSIISTATEYVLY